jgi:adenine phosphoribosyltransferase
MNLKQYVRRIPEFKGVVFWDITPLLKDASAFNCCVDELVGHYVAKMGNENDKIRLVVSTESRGFIFGSVIAHALGVGFVPIRKEGKLPYKTINCTYSKEYETDTLEMHEDAIAKGQNVLIIDDLLATGGTTKACIDLVERLGGNVVGLGFVLELEYLNGRKLFEPKHDVFSLVKYEHDSQ